MTTISFSVDDETAQDFAAMAQKRGVSKSDLFRTMYRELSFRRGWYEVQEAIDPYMQSLGITNEKELEEYLESGETYEDRIRHQRVRAKH